MFENWVNMHVTGWGSCDDLCVGNLGYFLYKFPEYIPNVKSWVTSENPMVRRAAAVTFIYSLRRKSHAGMHGNKFSTCTIIRQSCTQESSTRGESQPIFFSMGVGRTSTIDNDSTTNNEQRTGN